MSEVLLCGPIRLGRRLLHRDGRRRDWRNASLFNVAVSLAVIVGVIYAAVSFLRWGILDATWSGTAEECRAHGGACWAFVRANLKLMVFATYPSEMLWRPELGTALILALMGTSMVPRLWGKALLAGWVLVPVAVCLLLGGFPGPRLMSTNEWGGLPLTLLIWAVAYASAFPIAVVLALARRSKLGGVKTLATGFIELVRAMPMVVVLYVSSLIVPMALPFVEVNLFLSIAVALTFFIASYLAEVIRAGLQALPAGQAEAARALGLNDWQTTLLVILPQALRNVIPPLVNLGIGILLSTPLVGFVGMIDFLTAVRLAAAQEQLWPGCYGEAYCFAGAIYFALCFASSRYSRWLERRIHHGGR